MSYMLLDIVGIDHSYAKPWSAHPDASNARPLRTLYMEKFPRNKPLDHSMLEADISVDVVGTQTKTPTSYDVMKSRSVMHETEKQVGGLHNDRGDDWEDKINKAGWTQQQNRLFVKMNKILNSDRLGRLAFAGNVNEAVLRRNHLDKTSRRVRQTLGTVKWETKLIQWLHGMLLDSLGSQTLALYIEVLQTLKTKVPSLIERMTAVGGVSVRSQQLAGDLMSNLIKKPWDPVQASLSSSKMKKLPGNPLILVAPSGPTGSGSLQSKRMKYWSTQLSNLGKVIPVMMHIVNNGSGVGIAQCLEHMIVAVKNKVVELRSHFVNRPIVLLGWNIGALVACHVALQETVSAVVCMGFPYMGVGGGRGDADDPLLDCRTPTLFVIGQHANTCSIDNMEDLREKMRAENSLVVVGGSDDNLRMSRSKKKLEAVTQMMVDKTILEEMSEFLGGVLSQGPMVQESVIVDLSDLEARKQRNSAAKMAGIDDIDSNNYATPANVELPTVSPQGRMTIAKALRARGIGSSSSFDSPQSLGSITSIMGSPVKVKRKYTKRKGVTKPAGLPSPRKRIRSTPTPPVASPVTSIPSPLSLSAGPSVTRAPELSGLLRNQPGMLPTFRIVTDESGQKTALFSTPQTIPTPSEQPLTPTVNLPSPAILGQMEEPPLVAYKLEDYNKKFGTESKVEQDISVAQRQTISIESLLRSQQTLQRQQETQMAPVTSTPISSLLSLARHIPVQITTASSVSSQIQQLLSNLARTQQLSLSTASSLPAAHMIASIQSTGTTTYSNISSQSSGLTQLQLSQSGSPLQNSVPTLMSSLAKTTAFPGGSMIKNMTSSVTEQPSITIQEPVTENSPAVQKIDFHDFSVPSTSTAFSGTQTPETIDLTLTPGDGDSSSKRTDHVESPIHITLGQSQNQPSTQQQPLALVVEKCSAPGQTPEVTLIAKPVTTTFTSQVVSPVSHGGMNVSSVSHGGMNVGQLREETLGKVSSMLESSPITEKQATVIDLTVRNPTSSVQEYKPTSHAGNVSISIVTQGHRSGGHKTPPSVSSSYTATSKPSLGTLASTRTRRIRTPKQYDL